jgi:hypothetical protein
MQKSAEHVSFERSLRCRNSQFCEVSHVSQGASFGPAVVDLVCVNERPTLLAALLDFSNASELSYFCADILAHFVSLQLLLEPLAQLKKLDARLGFSSGALQEVCHPLFAVR